MERKIRFAEGEFYHLYSRGVDKKNVFLDDHDRARFLSLLYFANGDKAVIFRDLANKKFSEVDMGKKKIAIGAYVLMPNHFHLLVKEVHDGGLSNFMEKLLTGYSMYFNKRHERAGPLFQSRFKAAHVDRDEYLKYLFAYIHLNPVKLIEPKWKELGIKSSKRAEKFLHDFHYSSYADYLGVKREEGHIISPKEFPSYFEKTREFKKLVRDWMEYKEEE